MLLPVPFCQQWAVPEEADAGWLSVSQVGEEGNRRAVNELMYEIWEYAPPRQQIFEHNRMHLYQIAPHIYVHTSYNIQYNIPPPPQEHTHTKLASEICPSWHLCNSTTSQNQWFPTLSCSGSQPVEDLFKQPLEWKDKAIRLTARIISQLKLTQLFLNILLIKSVNVLN